MGARGGVIAASRGGIAADTEAPTAPSNVLMTPTCQTTGTITWSASTDNVGVTGYKIYRNGVEVYDVAPSPRTKAVTGLTANTSYTWTMKAYDAASNLSAVSNSSIKTQPPTVTAMANDTTIVGENSASLACSNYLINELATYYLTGGNGIPNNGEVMYEDSCATTPFNGGNLWYSDEVRSYQIAVNGSISNVATCVV